MKRTRRDDVQQSAPILIPGALYSLEQLMHRFQMSEMTLAKWRKAGLKVRFPGTRRGFVFADDVFSVIRKLSEEDAP